MSAGGDPLLSSGSHRVVTGETASTDAAPDQRDAAGTPNAGGPWTRHIARDARRRRRRRVLLVLAIVVVPVAYSYLSALTGPGSDSLSARSVEWMRNHHLGGVVDGVERRWYDHHQAKVGGDPGVAIATPRLADAAPAATTRTVPQIAEPSTAPTSESRPTATAPPAATSTVASPPAGLQPLPAPAPLTSPAPNPVADEGRWTPIDSASNGAPGAYATLIRPDDVHTSILDAVVWIDPHIAALRHYPGANLPGAPWDRPDHVESASQARLIAAFNGGFRLADSHGGMILGGQQIAPMRIGAATLTIDANGVPNVGAWGSDIDPTQPVDSARQNLDLIVDGGAPVPNLLTDPNRQWGFTGPANKSAVWRSGAGITADGALVWVGGPGLTVETLAETLVRAGAIRGMQLDINHDWVQLNTYTTGADGRTTGTKMLDDMRHTGDRWLTEDTRDFVAVFARAGSS